VPGDLIWGATARVLTELLCVVTGVDWPEAKGLALDPSRWEGVASELLNVTPCEYRPFDGRALSNASVLVPLKPNACSAQLLRSVALPPTTGPWAIARRIWTREKPRTPLGIGEATSRNSIGLRGR